jgi:hypothetical protein
MQRAGALHPLTRACFAFWLWPRAGIEPQGGRFEGAVVAARIAAAEARGGAVFAPLAAGGAAALRAGGTPPERLAAWLSGLEQGLIASLRRLDRIEAWQAGATAATADLSGRTPARLIAALAARPLVSAPVAEALTGASRAAVQRNLALFEARGLVREVTGQGRFRLWRADAPA